MRGGRLGSGTERGWAAGWGGPPVAPQPTGGPEGSPTCLGTRTHGRRGGRIRPTETLAAVRGYSRDSAEVTLRSLDLEVSSLN